MQKAILQAISQAQRLNAKRNIIYEDSAVSGKHEFLFFIKPEITQESRKIQLRPILDLLLGQLQAFELKIKNALLLPAPYLNEYHIISQHYGIINAIARVITSYSIHYTKLYEF